MKSLIAIAPIDVAPAINSLIEHVEPSCGPDNLSFPLFANGSDQATHLGCCLVNPSDWFMAVLAEGLAGQYATEGYDAGAIQALLQSMILDYADDISSRAHFDAVLAANGLSEMPASLL